MGSAVVVEHPRDLTVLAQLHAALDSVVETQEALRAVAESGYRGPAVKRLEELAGEARELLRSLLARPLTR